MSLRLSLAIVMLTWATAPLADEARVAVAANFTLAMRALAPRFEQASGHRLVVSTGSTGKLYAQILHGAPYDVFLAADQERPRLLEKAGRASGRFTYAIGRLALWARQSEDPQAQLQSGSFRHLAIANPKTAPYGKATVQMLRRLGLYPAVAKRLVIGENVGQARQFVSTGNADLGVVALAQVLDTTPDHVWPIPPMLHDPVRQDAVLLARGKRHPAAVAFLEFLRSEAARRIIRQQGYATAGNHPRDRP